MPGRNMVQVFAGEYFSVSALAWHISLLQNLSSTPSMQLGAMYSSGQVRRRFRLSEKGVVTPDELLSALKRYLAESGDTEEAVASQIGVNHHTLHRWLSDKQSPKKGK